MLPRRDQRKVRASGKRVRAQVGARGRAVRVVGLKAKVHPAIPAVMTTTMTVQEMMTVAITGSHGRILNLRIGIF